MLEIVFVLFLLAAAYFYVRGHPAVKAYFANKAERETLRKRHVRLHKARQDMLVSIHFSIAPSVDAL